MNNRRWERGIFTALLLWLALVGTAQIASPQFGNATRIQGLAVKQCTPTDGQALVWVAANLRYECTSSTPPFSTITAGTNTTALVIGTSGSLGVSGSGTINATSLGGVTSAAGLARPCDIIIGSPGAASPALANDNDTPQACGNTTGVTMTITAVSCYANTGSPTVTPIISGGSSTSILTGALTCSQASGGAAGTLNGTPTQTTGQLIDGNITTAGGTAKYIVLRITRSL